MNNTVLQRLIHGYQLINLDDFEQEVQERDGVLKGFAYKNDPLNTATSKIWEQTFTTPKHFGMGFESGDIVIAPRTVRGAMQNLSKDITQAMKFYIDLNDENQRLSNKELNTILDSGDLKFYAPYPETFLQLDAYGLIWNLLIEDDGLKTGDTGEPILRFFMSVWHKADQQFQLDLNKYEIVFHDENTKTVDGLTEKEGSGGYTFFISDSVFKELTDQSGKQVDGKNHEQYTNKSLNSWVEAMNHVYCLFMIYLQYPQIATPKNRKGRNNQSWFDMPMRKHTTTEYRNKPSFEHKELVIQMYENQGGKHHGHKRSGGTAFHSVRKHMLRTAKGKYVWRKAHFRGSKDVGVVNKDYKINTG